METTLGKWIAANQALLDCQAKFTKDQIDAMSSADQAGICKNEASAVEAFLRNDSITIKNLIAERVKHMH